MRALLLSLTVLQLSVVLPVGRQWEVQTQHLQEEKNVPDGQAAGGLGKQAEKRRQSGSYCMRRHLVMFHCLGVCAGQIGFWSCCVL